MSFFHYPSITLYLKYIFHNKRFFFPWRGELAHTALGSCSLRKSFIHTKGFCLLWCSEHHETHPRRAIHEGQENKWTERQQQSERLPAYICRWEAAGNVQLCLTSQEEGPPHQLVSAVCTWTYVRMNMHVCLCICAVVTSEGRRRCCQQVNPALRLSIKLSDQRINNSDGSLSGSITEHRLRGRQRHSKGTEVIYSLVQLTHIQIKLDADSLRNCASVHSPKSHTDTHK